MKTLYLIRHAKSSWKDIALDDFDRPLSIRGKNDVQLMANKLNELDILPDLIISSPAKRATTTANTIANTIGYKKKIEYENKIYESNMITLKNLIKGIDDEYNTVFIVGHNPGLNMLAEELCGFLKNIATTGIVAINFDCNLWNEISNQNSYLIEYIYPKKYK